MNKVQFTQQVSLGQQGNTLVIAHTTYDEKGIQNGRTQAIVNILPGDENKKLLDAATTLWKLTGRANVVNGFVQSAEQVRPLAQDEIKGIKKLGRGYLVTIEVESDILAEDITHSGVESSIDNELMDFIKNREAVAAK